MNQYLFFSIFFLFHTILNAQFIECQAKYGNDWADKYKITAKKGLKLRDNPSLDSKVLTVIPFNREVRICYENSIKATIDDINGQWVKTYWNEWEGFVFDGYVEEVEERSIMDISSSYTDYINDFSEFWKRIKFEKGDILWGLYQGENCDHLELREIQLEDEEDFSIPLNKENAPIWLIQQPIFTFSGIKKIKKIERMLFVGDKIYYKDGGVLYGNGKVTTADSPNIDSISINPYELRYYYSGVDASGKPYLKDELLVKMQYSSCHLCGGGATVHYIGDFDMDGKEDILISYSSTYKGWEYGLFSTRYAEEGKMFKEFTVGYGTT